MLSKRPRKTTVLIQEVVQSLQGAFNSSRCVCVVSALCRIREMLWGKCCCCSLPDLCWDLGRRGQCLCVLLGVEGEGVFARWWEILWWTSDSSWWISDSCSPWSSFKNKTNIFFSYCPFITSLSSLGFPGKNIAWSFLFTWLIYGTVILSLFSKPFVHKIIPWMAAL